MTVLDFFVLLADNGATPPTTEAPKQPPPGGLMDWLASPIVMLIPIVILFYLIMIRPMRRQEAERQKLLSALSKNDKILMKSGMYGTVVGISETDDEITVKIDDNVRVKIVKDAILRNLTNEERLKTEKAAPASPPTTAVTNQPTDKK